jgi:lipid A 3-O-deacylase
MKDSLRITGLVLSVTCLSTACLSVSSARAQTPPKPEEKGVFSLVVENDLFTHTDRAYTSGVRASWVTAPADTPAWALQLARQLPLFAGWGVVRTEYAVQQAIFTPRNTDLSIPDPADRPYAGSLSASFGLIGETGPLLDQLSLSVGVVGPASMAREAQKLVHNILGEGSPRGWAYQLHDEPTLQLRYQRSWRALAAYAFDGDYGLDLTPHAGFALGNVYTFAHAGVTFRIGKDLQQDYGPPRVGPSVPGAGFFEPRTKFGWYLFAGVEGRAVARNIFLDGNTFVDSPHVSKRALVADIQGGLAITYDRLRLSYTQVWRSKEFYGQATPEKFGAISASVRW